MSKKHMIAIVVIGILMLGAVAVYAQQNGARNGGRGGMRGNSGMYNADSVSGMGMGAAQNGQQRGQMNQGQGIGMNLPPATVDELPQDVIDLMIAGWVDEQHAYAAYESIMEQFGEIRPFTNIQQAEVQHAEAWELLFERYDIPVPAMPTFDIPVFDSVQDACALGAEAEIANMELYDDMLAAFEPYPDVYQVALALRDASEFSHLPAFESCARL